MIGGVTHHMLPHLPGVPHLHVNCPLNDTPKKTSKLMPPPTRLILYIQGFWQSARVRSRTIDQKSHYFALFAFSRTLPHFSRLFAKKNHKLQN